MCFETVQNPDVSRVIPLPQWFKELHAHYLPNFFKTLLLDELSQYIVLYNSGSGYVLSSQLSLLSPEGKVETNFKVYSKAFFGNGG